MFDLPKPSYNLQLLLAELQARGVAVRQINDITLLEATLGKHTEIFSDGIVGSTAAMTNVIFGDKFYAKRFVQDKGFAVVPGAVFAPTDLDMALAYAAYIGYPVVLKPTNASQGNLVFAALADDIEFRAAFAEFAPHTTLRNMLVEKHFDGLDYRFLVIANGDIAVAKCTPPSVVGDGSTTIRGLIAAENKRRMQPRTTCLCEIYIDDIDGMRCLHQQGLNADYVPKVGESIRLRQHANICWGADCANAVGEVHPSYIEIARKMHALFPGSIYTAVDLLIRDASQPARADNYVFLEFSPWPGFSMHEKPGRGKSHPVVSSIVDVLFPETAKQPGLISQIDALKQHILAKARDKFEQDNIQRDLRAFMQRLDSEEYANTDFLARQTFDTPRRTHEFFNYLKGYYAHSLQLQQLLQDLPISNMQLIQEFCPGCEPKLALALQRLGFNKTLRILDNDSEAGQQMRTVLDIFGLQYAVEFINQDFYAAKLSPAELVVGNHILDDLVLDTYCKNAHLSLDELYANEHLFKQATAEVCLDFNKAAFIERFCQQIHATLQPKAYLLLTHYRGVTEIGLGLQAWGTWVGQLLLDIAEYFIDKGYQGLGPQTGLIPGVVVADGRVTFKAQNA